MQEFSFPFSEDRACRDSTSLNADEIRRHFHGLQIWSRHGRRAPNKPLLVLWAIGRCMSGQERLATYERIDDELSRLMREFGRPGSGIRTHYPFWRLKNDGVWEVLSPTEIRRDLYT